MSILNITKCFTRNHFIKLNSQLKTLCFKQLYGKQRSTDWSCESYRNRWDQCRVYTARFTDIVANAQQTPVMPPVIPKVKPCILELNLHLNQCVFQAFRQTYASCILFRCFHSDCFCNKVFSKFSQRVLGYKFLKQLLSCKLSGFLNTFTRFNLRINGSCKDLHINKIAT